MQVGSSTNQPLINLLNAGTSSDKAEKFDRAAEETAGSKVPATKKTMAEIMSGQYDLTNISPREVDRFAKELFDNGLISTQESMILLTRGAEFMSHSPGANYTEAQLNEKSNLIEAFQNSIKLSQSHGGSTEGVERLLAKLEKAQAQEQGSDRLTSQVSDETLSGLIDIQLERRSI